MNPGERVEMTEAALQKGLDGPKNRRTGVVKAVLYEGENLKVLRDGEHRAEMWSSQFWRKVTNALNPL